ncbi:MAG TPA: hypothetical protein VES89_11700, partial [Candidatus Competibacteraceae bacterium]|nr:hypothetical protein [Candidatus Competibacteraceae bacterium]
LLEYARTVVLSRATASLDAPQAPWASLACAPTHYEAVVRGPRSAVELPHLRQTAKKILSPDEEKIREVSFEWAWLDSDALFEIDREQKTIRFKRLV